MRYKEFVSVYDDSARYVNHNRLLSHNADISISQSIRNLGKSYDMMMKVKTAMMNGFNCAWCRWDKTELAIAVNEFSRDDENLKVKKIKDSTAYEIEDINNGTVCDFFAVKQATSYKGLDIPNLKWMVYDEFIPEFYNIKTRKDIEFDRFMSLYVTLKRVSDMRAVLISNCLDWFNGYTKAWNINPFPSGFIRVFTNTVDFNGIEKTVKIAFENVKPSHTMIERVLKDELLKGNTQNLDDYFNNVAKSKYDLIEKCPVNIPFENIQIRVNNDYYSYRKYNGLFYFSKCKPRAELYVNTGDFNVRKNEIRNTEIGSALESMINSGCARFTDGHTYNAILKSIWDYRKRL